MTVESSIQDIDVKDVDLYLHSSNRACCLHIVVVLSFIWLIVFLPQPIVVNVLLLNFLYSAILASPQPLVKAYQGRLIIKNNGYVELNHQYYQLDKVNVLFRNWFVVLSITMMEFEIEHKWTITNSLKRQQILIWRDSLEERNYRALLVKIKSYTGSLG